MKKPVYLIDGYGLIYRSYFAHIKNPLKNAKGENTSAVFGFVASLDKLLHDKKPESLAVIMDSRTPTFRHVMYPEYKATRDAAPPDLHVQIPIIEKILDARSIPVFRCDGFEADDLIATIAEALSSSSVPCVIYTKDKDLLQLVNTSVSILYPGQGQEYAEWSRDEVFANKGIYPEQVIDFLALTGDSSDNVPGVAGVGEKTAIKLLAEHKTLDAVYEHLDALSASVRDKLEKGRESALLSRTLVTLRKDVPCTTGAEAFRIGETDLARLKQIYASLDFKSLVKKLGDVPDDIGRPETPGLVFEPAARASRLKKGADAAARDEGDTPSAESADAIPDAPLKATAPGTYKTITSVEDLDRWIDASRKAGIVSFDTETTGVDAVTAKPVGFSLCYEEGSACYVPIKAVDAECIPVATIKTKLAALLTDPDIRIVGQNIKYDYMIMRQWGITIANPWFDTMLAAWVLDPGGGPFNMDHLAEKHLRFKTIKYTDLIPKKDSATLADLPIATVTDYAGEDADITFRLYAVFARELEKKESEPLARVFRTIEMPLVPVLAGMELEGILLENGYLEKYGKELDERLEALERKIYDECQFTFNIRSTKELQSVLFERLKLPQIRKTKTGSSTDADVLTELALESTVAQYVLDFRTLSKLKSTYADSLSAQCNRETKRLHTQYLQTGTATGRLSSISPNLQNIPVRDEEGRRIRTAFIAGKGMSFISADYSQIELVVLAHLSKDPRLTAAFKNGKDVHTQTASIIYGVKEPDVTTAMRRVGKTINFGVIYGMSAYRLSHDLKIPRSDADAFINAYFTEYAGVRAFSEQLVEQAKSCGYVETLMGRRRRIDKRIASANKTEQAAEERIAVNSPVQGSAADIVKLAMIRVTERFASNGLAAKLLLQVHDELIFEVPEAELEQASAIVRETMEHVVSLDVPLNVGISVGKNWGELH